VWRTKRSPDYWRELAQQQTGNGAALLARPVRGSNQTLQRRATVRLRRPPATIQTDPMQFIAFEKVLLKRYPCLMYISPRKIAMVDTVN